MNLLATTSLESAGTLPERLQALLAQSHYFVLPPRRPDRHFPRVVKNRAHKFPTKKMPVSVNWLALAPRGSYLQEQKKMADGRGR
ncbi:hypothetical protein [Caldimonas tepidiphila]|uniref:hypothetical protein n=1 Tax=Caldimonas tepidiphila TaxID=2315841 RepID=UPI0013005D40|nr:hypothetical protein [Caldimonas tepidiphila]